eukprot:3195162-Alexandrium_andersonii.AAC.1
MQSKAEGEDGQDASTPLRGSRQHMAAEAAALDAAAEILEGLAVAGAFDEQPNPAAVEAAA